MAGEDLTFLDGDPTRDSSFSGMAGLFNMANGFAEMVQPKTLEDLATEYNIEEWGDFDSTFMDDWEEWVMYLIGYAICMAIGILFVIVMPIVGCCFGCCRCCGCCGGKTRRGRSPEEDNKMRLCCSVVTIVLSATMVAVSACAIVASAIIYNESLEGKGFLNDIANGVHNMDDYIVTSVGELEEASLGEFSATKLEVYHTLDQLPSSLTGAFETETQVETNLGKLVDFADQLESLNGSLHEMDFYKNRLHVNNTQLDTALTGARRNLKSLINTTSCQRIPICKDLSEGVDYVAVTSDYSLLNDVTPSIVLSEAAIQAGIPEEAQTGKEALNNITQIAEDETTQEIDILKDNVDDAESEVQSYYDEFNDWIGGVDFDSAANSIRDAEEMTEFGGMMAASAMSGLALLQMIAALLFLIGAILGLVLKPRTISSSTCSCTSQHASRLLMSGAIFTFILSWIYMLIIIALFLLGGITHNMVCRHLVTFDGTTETVERLTVNQFDLDMNNRSIEDVLVNCKKDEPLYTALRLDEFGYNITEYLDLENYGVDEAIEDIKDIQFNIGTVNVITPAVNDSVLEIYSELLRVDFDEYLFVLNENITQISLTLYASRIRNAAISVHPTNATLADDLRAEADDLEWAQNNLVEGMKMIEDVMRPSVLKARQITNQAQLDTVMADLAEAETEINNNGTTMLSERLVTSMDAIWWQLGNMSQKIDDNIRQDTAQCRPVYEAMQDVIVGACVFILYPLNSIWFCYGWYVAFSLIILFTAVNLSGIYRTQYPRKVSRVSPEPQQQITFNITYQLPKEGGNQGAYEMDSKPMIPDHMMTEKEKW